MPLIVRKKRKKVKYKKGGILQMASTYRGKTLFGSGRVL
jgi:hypothetical protein